MVTFLFSDFNLGGAQKIAIEIFNRLIKTNPETKIVTIQNKGVLKKK